MEHEVLIECTEYDNALLSSTRLLWYSRLSFVETSFPQSATLSFVGAPCLPWYSPLLVCSTNTILATIIPISAVVHGHQKGSEVHDHFVNTLIQRHTGCIGCVWSPPCCSALYRNPSLHSTLLPRSRSLAYPRPPNPLHSTAPTSSSRPFPIPVLTQEYRHIFQAQAHSQIYTFSGPTEMGQI